MRINEKSEAEEHDDLEQPGKSVHERINVFAVHDLVVSYHDTCDIYGKVTISFSKSVIEKVKKTNASNRIGYNA